ncbi:MAG: phenylalanine--tRNA ligase subunit alpha [archaeon]
MDLHPLEKKVLEGLQKLNGSGSASEVAKAGGIEKIQAERFGYSLSQKKLVELEKVEHEETKLTELGKQYAEAGLPEKHVLELLHKGAQPLVEIAKALNLTQNEISAVLGILKKSALVSAMPSDKGLMLEITSIGNEALKKGIPSEVALKKATAGAELGKDELADLRKRGFVEVEKGASYNLKIIGEVGDLTAEDTVQQLTHEMLKSGSWKGKKFRKYDLNAEVPKVFGGKLHPLTIATNKIRKIYLQMGFEEADGPVVESSFWNFDALFQPQDHPCRDLADTFYLENPKESKLPDAKIVENVKNAHEKGVKNSSGWGYKWTPDIAKNPVLRTHCTAVSARWLSKVKPPAKVFSIGRTFRNETVDYKHLPEFTQIDGIVVDENATFKDHLGYLKEFFWRLGFEKIRFRPSYFPYTEMSVEPEVWMESIGEWIELGGSGIFRPEVTEPLGINVPVLAWGLSLERPIMLALGLKDIRYFYYKNDLKWLRETAYI